MEKLREIIKEIWSDGVKDFEEIDRNWDPSERKEGMEEAFEQWWKYKSEKIVDQITEAV